MMKKEQEPNNNNIQWQDNNDLQIQQSCPTQMQVDLTNSQNIKQEKPFRMARSGQFTNHGQADSPTNNNKQKNELIRQAKNKFFTSSQKIKDINKHGKNFNVDEVQSESVSVCDDNSVNSRTSLSKKAAQLNQKNQQRQAMKSNEGKGNGSNNAKQLNILVAGSQDTGKSTFIECFKGIEKRKSQQSFVNFIDLPGFTHYNLNNYINDIYKRCNPNPNLNPNPSNNSSSQHDNKQIHCILYFLTGFKIKKQDLEIMKSLCQNFNLIPVLAKSDQYTKDQIKDIKKSFYRLSSSQNIKFFDLKQILRFKQGTQQNLLTATKFGQCPPFAIACSNNKIREIDASKSIFVREYTYGTLNIESQQHTQLLLLIEILTNHVKEQLIIKAGQFNNVQQVQQRAKDVQLEREFGENHEGQEEGISSDKLKTKFFSNKILFIGGVMTIGSILAFSLCKKK